MCVDSFIDCCCFKNYFSPTNLFFFWQAGTILRTRPKRIILVRHGQSEGNIDESAYTRIPDSKIAHGSWMEASSAMRQEDSPRD